MRDVGSDQSALLSLHARVHVTGMRSSHSLELTVTSLLKDHEDVSST